MALMCSMMTIAFSVKLQLARESKKKRLGVTKYKNVKLIILICDKVLIHHTPLGVNQQWLSK